jgi:hypothetical protein
MSYSSTNNPFTNAAAGFSSNSNTVAGFSSNNKNNTNNTNNKFANKTNNSQKLSEPIYKNRWEDPNYVKDLRYDMDWSN